MIPTIGVFDSGLGGLTVLREIHRQLPGVSVLYLADTANVPYGDKPIEVVRDLALRLSDHLVSAGVSVIIMASGTSTAAGLEAAQARYPDLPMVGTIAPGARAATLNSAGPIGVIATNATVQSLAFTKAVHALEPPRQVVEQGCPAFVPLVEAGRAESAEVDEAAFEYLLPLHRAGVQSVILGCTHFPFLLPALHRAICRIGDPEFRPRFIDPSAEAVGDAARFLQNSSSLLPGPSCFAATSEPDLFRRHASELLGETISNVDWLTLQ